MISPGNYARDWYAPCCSAWLTRTNGALRWMKALLLHQMMAIAETAQRLGMKAGNDAIAYVMKTLHITHG